MSTPRRRAKKREMAKPPPRAVSRALKMLPPAAELERSRDGRLVAAGEPNHYDEASLRADPVGMLWQFVYAVELGYFPHAKVCRILASVFRDYLENAGKNASLDRELGLSHASARSGRGTPLARKRIALRDAAYLRAMVAGIQSGQSEAKAAAETARNWNAFIRDGVKAAPLDAAGIALRFRKVLKTSPAYALLMGAKFEPPSGKS